MVAESGRNDPSFDSANRKNLTLQKAPLMSNSKGCVKGSFVGQLEAKAYR